MCAALDVVVQERTAEADLLPSCDKVIEAARQAFAPVYDACWGKIAAAESEGIEACRSACDAAAARAVASGAMQTTSDVVELFAAAARARAGCTEVMRRLGAPQLGEEPALKSICRIAEKIMLRADAPGRAERVCDVVRDMFTVGSMEEVATIVQAFVGCSDIEIVRRLIKQK